MKRTFYTFVLLGLASVYLLACVIWPVVGLAGFIGFFAFACWQAAGGYLDAKG